MKPAWNLLNRVALFLWIVGGVSAGDVPGWRRVGNARQDFEISLDRETRRRGNASGRLECIVKRSTGIGTLEQDFTPEAYLGQRIRLTAWLKGENAGRAMLFMRTENDSGQVLEFGNTQDHAFHGTFEWRKTEIVLDVSPKSTVVQMGLILDGSGKAWMDDVSIEVVDKHVKSTANFRGPGPANPRRAGIFVDHPPQNLDFEQ